MNLQERDLLLLGYLDGTLDEEEHRHLDAMLRERPEWAGRLAELSLNDAMLVEAAEALGRDLKDRTGTRRRTLPARSSFPAWIGAVAAAALAVLFFGWWTLAGGGKTGFDRRPIVDLRREDTRVEAPPVPPPKDRPPEAARLEHPGDIRPVPAPPAPATVDIPSPKEAPPGRKPLEPADSEKAAPLPEKEAPPASRVAKDRPPSPPLALLTPRGSFSRVRAGRSEPVLDPVDVGIDDILATGPRRGASFQLGAGIQCSLDRSTSIGLGRTDTDDLRITLQGGTLFLRTREAAVVTAPFGEVLSSQAVFQVEVDPKHLQVIVLEGSVQIRNAKGDQQVRAGQRAALRAGEKPSSPAKADPEAATGWSRAPILASPPPEGPYLEREPGGNRRMSGLVLAAPYADGEAESGRMARAVAEAADAALVLGHGYRDPRRRLWINVDRGMEGDVAPDGTASNERFTDRSRRATAEYLEQCRMAVGAGARETVPVIFQFRTHYLKQGGVPLDLAEIAASGWSKAVLLQMKGHYAQLLEKNKVAARLEIKVQGVDDTYDWRGTRRKFTFTEDDAREEGYLASRNSRNALTIFLPEGFARAPGELESYARVFAELGEYLNGRRR